jgi:hypothetical protein
MKTSFSLLHSVCFSSSSRTDAVKIAGMMKTINTTAMKTSDPGRRNRRNPVKKKGGRRKEWKQAFRQ